jgi:hypothetical protein
MSILLPLPDQRLDAAEDLGPRRAAGTLPTARLQARLRLTARADPTELKLHRAHCAAARGQLHGLRGAVDAVDAFLSPRFFSTLVVLSAAGLALAWWLA